jgi:hypothetical protein
MGIRYSRRYQIEASKGNLYAFEGFSVLSRGKAKTVVMLVRKTTAYKKCGYFPFPL